MANDSRVGDIVGTLGDINRGNFLIEAGRKLTELTEACVRTRGKGKIVITLNLSPAGVSEASGRVNQFTISPKVEIRKPELKQPAAIFFCTENDMLTRDDPDQMEMELHEKETTRSGRD
jgi:hypothetical protein